MVPIMEVAEALGVSKDYALRLVRKRSAELGLTPIRGKRNAVLLSRVDADRLIANYEPRPSRTASVEDLGPAGDFGWFYMIQLHPDDLPDRVKLGYTDNISQRLSDHRTTAPTLQLLKSWRCKRIWEPAAIASITRSDCVRKGHEVFDGTITRLLDRADEFFALLPAPPVEEPTQFDR